MREKCGLAVYLSIHTKGLLVFEHMEQHHRWEVCDQIYCDFWEEFKNAGMLLLIAGRVDRWLLGLSQNSTNGIAPIFRMCINAFLSNRIKVARSGNPHVFFATA
jgi:hypothetical protein